MCIYIYIYIYIERERYETYRPASQPSLGVKKDRGKIVVSNKGN